MLSLQPYTRIEWIPPAKQLPENCLSQIEAVAPGWEVTIPPFETIMPEIAVADTTPHRSVVANYFTGNDRIGYTLRPPWMRYFGAPKLQPGPVARLDRKPQQTIARLTEHIQKDAEEDSPRGQAYIGSKIGAFACVATDGHRALLVRDAFKGTRAKKKWPINPIPKPEDPHFVLDDPEIFNGLRRLATVTKDSSLSAVKFSLSAEAGTLVVSASDAEWGEGTETYDCKTTGDVKIGFNPEYVLQALGTWPLTVYFKDGESPVVMMPKTKRREFMYVLMPMKF